MWRAVSAAALLVATLAAAEPARVGCGPGQVGCGPAAVQSLGGAAGGGATTAAPSWVSSMLAAWMLDEVSGNRVNAQGTATRDLATADSTDPGSSTDHMEGTRSMVCTAPQSRHTTDTFSGVVSPLAMGCWVKVASVPSAYTSFMLHHYVDSTPGTAKLQFGGTSKYTFAVTNAGGTQLGGSAAAAAATNTWTHVVGTAVQNGSILVFVNGVQVATTAITTMSASANNFYLCDNSIFTGQLDECWFANLVLSAASVCRICSCGIRGEQCTCTGTAFASTGRNVSACGSCTLPSDCTAAAPS